MCVGRYKSNTLDMKTVNNLTQNSEKNRRRLSKAFNLKTIRMRSLHPVIYRLLHVRPINKHIFCCRYASDLLVLFSIFSPFLKCINNSFIANDDYRLIINPPFVCNMKAAA